MEELNALKIAVRDLFIEGLGVLAESDQINLRKQAQILGLDNRQFSQLSQEIYLSINWDALRDERQGKDRVVRPINIFGEEVRSLEKLGEILFDNRTKALKYLEDSVFLKENVTYLSHQNIDLTMGMMDIYASERNNERRFLKVCYQLNSSLPFKVGEESFSTVAEILDRGFMNHDFFMGIYHMFSAGHLQIWLDRQFPEYASILPLGDSYLYFLYFIYSVNQAYPIYVGDEPFLHYDDLVAKARQNAAFGPKLLQAAEDGSLSVWMERRGMEQMIKTFKAYASEIRTGEKNNDDLSKNLIQKLLEILAPEMEVPELTSAVAQLSFINIQEKPLLHPIMISLKNKGFVRARVSLDSEISGIWLSQRRLSLYDLDGTSSASFNLNVDPAKLTKDKLYTLLLKVETDYQCISIPVSVKTVFPIRAFLLCLLRYGFLGAAFFCIIRLFITTANGTTTWLKPELAWNNIAAQVPSNHLVYIIIFIITILVPIVAWPGIKKLEQL